MVLKPIFFQFFFVPNFVSGVASLSDTPRSSSWWRWKADVKFLMLEKKLDAKYFFVMEKFDFENLSMTFFLGAKIIFGKNIFPQFFWKKVKKNSWKNPAFLLQSAMRDSNEITTLTRHSESYWPPESTTILVSPNNVWELTLTTGLNPR